MTCDGGHSSRRYDLSGDPRLLRQARRAADRLLPAFGPRTGWSIFGPGRPQLPTAQLNLLTGHGKQHGWAPGPILAEVGSVQLEFARLFEITHDQRYAEIMAGIVSRRGSRRTAGTWSY